MSGQSAQQLSLPWISSAVDSPASMSAPPAKKTGLSGAQSGLWFEYLRIVAELKPSWVIVENVASGAHAWVDTVRSGLGQLGYESLPIPIEAADLGAPHKRARIFVVACHSDSDGKPVGAKHEKVAKLRSPARRFPGWSERPSVCLDDGIPEQLAAYGNAVMPAMGEAIGHFILELMSL